jgi:cell wall-associated NlpC family hydrolase
MSPSVRAVLGFPLALAVLAAGCASRGATPRPFPTPGDRRVARGPIGAADRPALLETALGQVGTPYRLGGDSPGAGFDCSGFVTWVFAQHGLSLPRTVLDLFGVGQTLGENEPLSGADLVFFETKGPGVSHVGIALGDGRFVHAPSSRGAVRVEALDSEYWSRRYIGARRLIIPQPVGFATGSSASAAPPREPQ